jgi:hypothetical protein
MMLSDVAVRRPVFAAVAAIILCVIGAAAFMFLPVRELPNVDPPIVSVNTTYRRRLGRGHREPHHRADRAADRRHPGRRPDHLVQP